MKIPEFVQHLDEECRKKWIANYEWNEDVWNLIDIYSSIKKQKPSQNLSEWEALYGQEDHPVTFGPVQ